MFKIVLVVVLVFCTQSLYGQRTRLLEGSYRFTSETIELIKPKSEMHHKQAPEWDGLLFLKDGHFSLSLVNQSRNDDWITRFPSDLDELGYDSLAGSYDFSGSRLRLKVELTLNPFNYGKVFGFNWKLDGDTLQLSEELKPSLDDTRKGVRMLTFKQITRRF